MPQLKRLYGLLSESPDQNLALTVLDVPCSLESSEGRPFDNWRVESLRAMRTILKLLLLAVPRPAQLN